MDLFLLNLFKAQQKATIASFKSCFHKFTANQRLLAWLTFGSTFIVALLAATNITAIHQQADMTLREEVLLSDIEEKVNYLNALEWQAIAQLNVKPEINLNAERQKTISKIEQELFELLQTAPDQYKLQPLNKAYYNYITLLDTEFRLIAAGNISEAQALDQHWIDPSYEVLSKELADISIYYQQLAQQEISQADLGTNITIVLAIITIGWIFWKFDKAQRNAQVNLAEQKVLCKSEERFRSLVQNASDLILIVDVDSIIRYISNSVHPLLDYQSTNLVNINFLNLVHPDDAAQVEKFLSQCSGSIKKPLLIEFRVRKDDKNWFYVEAVGNNLLCEPNISGLIINCRDISVRKQAEQDIRAALAKEKELTELKSSFVTLASHEFRTPLATILSSAELLEDYSYKWSEEKKLQHLQRIQTAVKQMTELLNDVLAIGKVEAGKLEIQLAPLDLLQFCQELVEQIQLTTSKHTISFCSQGECTALMDEKVLRHILSNLLSNAIKYSPQGGDIHFSLIYQQQQAIFQIQDPGIGIPIEDQALVFDSFHRGSNVSRISGTGLGLAIVKRSVDLAGGEITVNSEVGVGTTITVTLPLQNRMLNDEQSSCGQNVLLNN